MRTKLFVVLAVLVILVQVALVQAQIWSEPETLNTPEWVWSTWTSSACGDTCVMRTLRVPGYTIVEYWCCGYHDTMVVPDGAT